VFLIFVLGNHASSYAGCHAHSYFKNCNAEGFLKTSLELSQEGTIHRGVEAGNAFILWIGKMRPPIVFVPSFLFCKTFYGSEKLVGSMP
jgi:hypothetical protein